METPALNALPGSNGPSLFKDSASDVVEIALLLPTKRAEALIDLSRRRRQSVGQILRQLIDGALAEERAI